MSAIRAVFTASTWIKASTFSLQFSIPITCYLTLRLGIQITVLDYNLINSTPRCTCDFTYTIDFHFRGRGGKNAKSWHLVEVIYWTIREVLFAKLRQSRVEVERLRIYFQQLQGAGVYLSTMVKGGTSGAHILSSADLTDPADIPELYIEPDIDFYHDEVWIDDDKVPDPYIDYPSHWTLETHTHMDRLLTSLVEYLMEQFKGEPSYAKFKIIHELDPDYQESMRRYLRFATTP